jgi:hypothetical protein
MSDEENSGSGLKNALIGLVTIIVTAIAGVVGKQIMGGDDAPAPAPVVAPAPIINLNLENNNSVTNSGGAASGAAPAPAAAPKKDDHLKKEPLW